MAQPSSTVGQSWTNPIDLTSDDDGGPGQKTALSSPRTSTAGMASYGISTPASGVKRKRALPSFVSSSSSSSSSSTQHGSKPKPKRKNDPNAEKRLSRFRSSPPKAFLTILERAHSQRFYVLKRTRGVHPWSHCPEEEVELTGSTGNIYTVRICDKPTCDCPHAEKGNQCKHVVYVLSRVLRAPYHLVYQLALLTSELDEIFANAPPFETPAGEESNDRNRKQVEGECPICFDDLDPKSPERLVWCRAACGQNIHQECFGKWKAAKQGARVTCPLCRSVWAVADDEVPSDKLGDIRQKGVVTDEGYVNVGNALGYDGSRDTSTYYGYDHSYRSSRRRRHY